MSKTPSSDIHKNYHVHFFLTRSGELFFLSVVESEVSSEKSFSRAMLFMGRCMALGAPADRPKMPFKQIF